MSKLVIGHYDTPNFQFTTLAISDERARFQIQHAWRKHCKQTGADVKYFNQEDVNTWEIEPGEVFRDHESKPIFSLKK